jgi:hypothetical protein
MAVIFIGGPLIALWHVRWRRRVQKWVSEWVDKMLKTEKTP